MRSRTKEKPEEGHPGGRRIAGKEAVSLVKHCSMLSRHSLGMVALDNVEATGVPDRDTLRGIFIHQDLSSRRKDNRCRYTLAKFPCNCKK